MTVSYQSIVELSRSTTLQMRIAACAAMEDIEEPQVWAAQRMWKFAAQPGWADAWAYAKDNYTADQNPDIGARPDVISDPMILASVQALAAPTQ